MKLFVSLILILILSKASTAQIISNLPSSLCAGETVSAVVTGTSGNSASYNWMANSSGIVFSHTGIYNPTITFNAPGSFSIFLVLTNNGTYYHITYYITVHPNPTITAVPSQSAVCSGFTTQVSAQGATSYTWTGTSFTGNVAQPTIGVGVGIYTVVGSGSHNCKASSSFLIGWTPSLLLSTSADRPIFCRQGAQEEPVITLSASGASSYSWEPYDPIHMSNSFSASTEIHPLISTCYTVTGSTPVCSGQAVVCVLVSECVSLTEETQPDIHGFLVFPNPAKDHFILKTNGIGNISLEISDIFGKMMHYETFVSAGQTEKSIRIEIPAGIYFVTVTDVIGSKKTYA